MTSLLGKSPDQVPTNGDLGDMAFQNSKSVMVTGGRADFDLLKIGGVDVASSLAALVSAVAGKQDSIADLTWSPAFSPVTSGSVTMNASVGRYFRLGQWVVCTFFASSASISSPVGDMLLTGLPHDITAASPYGRVFGVINTATGFAGDYPCALEPGGSSVDYLALVYRATSNGATQRLQGSDLAAGLGDNAISGIIVYRTDDA